LGSYQGGESCCDVSSSGRGEAKDIASKGCGIPQENVGTDEGCMGGEEEKGRWQRLDKRIKAYGRGSPSAGSLRKHVREIAVNV
jgi:hypothetical protein